MECLKEKGFEKWYEKMNEDYTCKACGEINSAYDLKCRKCGTIPGNNFVERNKEAIVKALSRR